MPSSSPFADFYELVFTKAPKELQEQYLRKLFTMDGVLCASFSAYIDPPVDNITLSIPKMEAEIEKLHLKIRKYRWQVLFEIDPIAEDYSRYLCDLIDRDMLHQSLLDLQAYCIIGDLLSALNALRIIEMGTNVDWEALEEPASYYASEVQDHIRSQFLSFTDCFLGSIFSKKLIDTARSQAEIYRAHPGNYLEYTAEWAEVIEIFEDRLGKRI